MDQQKDRLSLIRTILEDEEENALEEEEIIRVLLSRKVTRNVNSCAAETLTLGDRMSDRIAKFVGSWAFILIFLGCLAGWLLLNILLAVRAVDPYPFILLNLMLSCVAAIQAPVIMMSQNRQEEKDRLRAQNDYKTNLKSEIIIEDLYRRIDRLVGNQDEIKALIMRLGGADVPR